MVCSAIRTLWFMKDKDIWRGTICQYMLSHLFLLFWFCFSFFCFLLFLQFFFLLATHLLFSHLKEHRALASFRVLKHLLLFSLFRFGTAVKWKKVFFFFL
jgi:hypothetical protein